jgi:hypothetical protein
MPLAVWDPEAMTAYLRVAGCEADVPVGSGIPSSGALRSLAEFMDRPLGGGKFSRNPRLGLLSAGLVGLLWAGMADGAEAADEVLSGAGAGAGLEVPVVVLAGIRTIPGSDPSAMARRLSPSD